MRLGSGDRRPEPFRLFFPLAILLGGVGVAPWILVWLGLLAGWPAALHATIMTQSFLIAAVIGFLGTMIPRRTQNRAMGRLEATFLAVGLIAIPAAFAAAQVRVAQLAYAGVLLALGVFLVRRRPRRDAGPLPSSFLHLPLALASGLLGTTWLALAPGRLAGTAQTLVLQAPLLFFVLAIAPMLGPIVTGIPAAKAAASPVAQAAIAAGFAVGFPLELISDRAGLLVRGCACVASVVAACPPWAPRIRRGLQRGLFRVALYFIPVGLCAAGILPERRVALLHLTFIAGLYLLVVAVSSHVVMLHTGREDLASRRPWALGVAGVLALAAALVRVFADRFWPQYFGLLALAALLWLASAAAWAAFLVALLRRAPRPTSI